MTDQLAMLHVEPDACLRGASGSENTLRAIELALALSKAVRIGYYSLQMNAAL